MGTPMEDMVRRLAEETMAMIARSRRLRRPLTWQEEQAIRDRLDAERETGRTKPCS